LKLSNKWQKAKKARLHILLLYEETSNIKKLEIELFDSLVGRLRQNQKHDMNNLMFDMPTVLFFLFFGNFISAILLAIYPIDAISRYPYTKILAGKLLQSVAWILLAARGSIPDVYSAHVGNSLLLGGLALEAAAIISANRANERKSWDFFYAIIVGIFIFVFAVFARKANQYVYISSWFAALIYLSAVVWLLSDTKKSVLKYAMGAVYAFLGLFLIARGADAYYETSFSLMGHNFIQDIVFLLTYSLMILSVASFLLLMRKRVNQSLIEANLKLDKLAYTDSLTGLANRRWFSEYLTFSIREHRRRAEPVTLIMIDIDYFKKYNDFYGHILGDQCLTKVAQELKEHFQRNTDLVARYGGEEFTIILWNTDDDQLRSITKAIHHKIKNLAIPHLDSDVSDIITISLGAFSAVPTSDEHDLNMYIAESDCLLYEAKRAGRNRSVHTNEMPPNKACT